MTYSYEEELEERAWNEWARNDFVAAIVYANEELEELFDEIYECKELFELFDSARLKADVEWTYGDGANIELDALVKKIEWYIEKDWESATLTLFVRDSTSVSIRIC